MFVQRDSAAKTISNWGTMLTMLCAAFLWANYLHAQATPQALAAQARGVMVQHCFECHGKNPAKLKARLNVFDRVSLLEKQYVVPSKPDDSELIRRVESANAPMPPRDQGQLSDAEKKILRDWVAAGAPPLPTDGPPQKSATPPRPFKYENAIGVDYVHRQILDYLRKKVDIRHVRFMRFFSLNHFVAAETPSEKLEVQLEYQRAALAKAINHLTWKADLVQPIAIDPPFDTVYCIDLRDLDWHVQPFAYTGKRKMNFFDIALLEYPYGVFYEDSDTFDHLVVEFLEPAQQVRPITYVRSDWFVSTMTQPPFYEDFLQLPFELSELEKKLGVDSESNLRTYVAKRAGMMESQVSRNNRVVERHASLFGYYWKSFDFRNGVGLENIARDEIQLNPAGGEFIFSLPNTMQGYFVANAKGVRLAEAPIDIVSDRHVRNPVVRNGLSCIRCHDRGMKPFEDDVRPWLETLQGSPGIDKEKALQLYPGQGRMDELVKRDGEQFRAGMARLLGNRKLTEEPLFEASERFLETPLRLETVARELRGVSPARLEAWTALPLFHGLGLSPLAAKKSIRRAAWESYFGDVVRTKGLGQGIPIVPLDGLSLENFPAGRAPFEVELNTNRRNQVFTPGDELQIRVTNYSEKPIYIELIGTDIRGKMSILAPSSTVVRPGKSYYFPSADHVVPIRAGGGKWQITLYASQTAFEGGELLQGLGVTDRFVHRFSQLKKAGDHYTLTDEAVHFVKRTIKAETK